MDEDKLFVCCMPYDIKHLDKLCRYWLGPKWVQSIRHILGIYPKPEPICVNGKGLARLCHVGGLSVLVVVAHPGCDNNVMEAWVKEYYEA